MKRTYSILTRALAVLLVLALTPLCSPAATAWADPAVVEQVQEAERVQEAKYAQEAEQEAEQALQPEVTQQRVAITPSESISLMAAASLTVGSTGGSSAGTVSLSATNAQAGDSITVSATPGSGYYLAQVRYSTDGGATYTALTRESWGYRFTMPPSAVDVKVDFVRIVWDGTIDLTWFNPEANNYQIQYPAQYAGLAALVNGLFTTYPTEPKVDQSNNPVIDRWGQVLLPAPQLFRQGMGISLAQSTDTSGALVPSRLYGEFSASYRLNDSQASYVRTAPLPTTTRVIGEPAYLQASVHTQDESGHGGQNQMTTNDFWNGRYTFAQKTVLITADLDFGATKDGSGAWSTTSPLFMPVGGQYSILPGTGNYTNAYSKLSASFNGRLDALGHNFTNVYAEYYANTEYGDAASIGLVGRLGVHDNDPADTRPLNPTVRQLVLESGYISGRRSTGGIVGKIGKTSRNNGDGSTGGIIELCLNKATIVGTDAKGCAGIVAAGWNGGVVRNCANFGRIDYRYADPAGGVSAYNEVPLYNSFNVGLVTAQGDKWAMGIGTNNGGGTPIVDCYWLKGKSAGGGYFGGNAALDKVYEFGADTSIPTLTAALLNVGINTGAVWRDDTLGLNRVDGVNYPVLYYQQPAFDASAQYAVSITPSSGGGTMTASASTALVGTSVELTATALPGYQLDYFMVNGYQLSGNSFTLLSNTTVEAVFRVLKEATLQFEDTSAKPYVLQAVKVERVDLGTNADGAKQYEYRPVAVLQSGSTVLEEDTLIFTATFKDAAQPTDPSLYYSGFAYVALACGSVVGTVSNGGVTTLTSTNLSNAQNGQGVITLMAKEQTAARNWGQLADTGWYSATTPQTAYCLTTPQQLAGLAVLVNNGTDFSGVSITLAADISLAHPADSGWQRLWVPIGNSLNPFRGGFNGQGKTISGLTIKRTESDSGLFGVVEGATLANFTLSGTVNAAQKTGAAVGLALSGAALSGITNRAEVSSSSNYVGGLVGELDGSTLSSCSNEAAVASSLTTADAIAGGVVGNARASATLTSVRNSAPVTGSYRVGGVAGRLEASSLIGSENSGAVTATASNTSSGAGGLVGNTSSSSLVRTSYNTGAISVTGPSNATYAGGLVGYNSTTLIRDCYNRGAVTASTGFAGGIVGYTTATDTSPTLLQNLYTTGAVSKTGVTGAVGALAGYVNSPHNTALNVSFLELSAGLTNTVNGMLNNTGASSFTATARTTAALKSLAPTLGNSYKAAEGTCNDGYPLLVWQEVSAPGAATGTPGSGDYDGDGRITAADALVCLRGASRLLTLTAQQADALDIDRDGAVTAADAIRALRMAAGLA